VDVTEKELTPGGRALEGVLEAVVAGFGLECVVRVVEDEDGDVVASVDGVGADALVGRGGAVIDALQYLGSQVVSRAEGGGRYRVTLDADGYRARREAALVALAERAAAEAVEFGEEIELDAMTPHDRRIVHMTLKDRDDVVTRSEGDEPRRRIVVEPAD
jgi:spoIIIJ-associated protein